MSQPKLKSSPGCMVAIVVFVIIVAWGSAMFIGAYRTYKSALFAEPATHATRKFLMLVGAGNLPAAKSMTTDAVTIDMLNIMHEQIKTWGGIKGDVEQRMGWNVQDMEKINITLIVDFLDATRTLSCDWIMIDGTPRLTHYQWQDPPATQPETKTAQ